MTAYEIRFLRPNGSYGAIARIDLETDEEAKIYISENYPQKPLELWRDQHRLTRRTSPAYERRLNNDPYYPSQPRFAAMSNEKSWSKLTDLQFEAVGLLSDRVFQSVQTQLAPHQIWVRATGHPQTPPQVDQKVRLSVSAGAPFDDELSGRIHCDLWSREADGSTIFDDCRDAVVAALLTALEEPGQVQIGPPWRDGIYNYLPISVGWAITVSRETQESDAG